MKATNRQLRSYGHGCLYPYSEIPVPPKGKPVKATDRQLSEVLRAFHRGLESVSKYQDTVPVTHQPAGRIEVKGIDYSVTVTLRKIEDEEKENKY